MSAVEINGRNLVVTDVIVKYVIKTLERDLEVMKTAGKDSFQILGRELRVSGEFHNYRFKGFIDRLDAFGDDDVRVVDYKTGKVLDDDVDIVERNAKDIADKIFAPDVKERPKIALQFYIYDMLLQNRNEVTGRAIYNCVYSPSRLFKEAPKSVPLNQTFYDMMTAHLTELLDELGDVNVGFRRTEEKSVCKYCDFKNICGK